MSKALPIIVATVLGAAALVPVYYATQHPEKFSASKSGHFDAAQAKPIEKLSYFYGHKVATQMMPPELDMDAFTAGVRAGHAHETMPYTEQELQAAYEAFAAQQQQESAQAVAGGAAATAARTSNGSETQFLQDNAKRAGVKTTPSGLQYEVLREGTGKQPQASDIVKVNYEGKLVNGEIFDSSYARGEPVEFPLNQVIPGWTEGLQLMKEGGEYMLYVPAQLGYGTQGTGPIPPNSTLIFKVELLQVKS